jgi:hypothetical protein
MSALKFPPEKLRESPRHLQGNPMGRLYSPVELSPPASIPRAFKNETSTEKSTMEIPLSIDGKTERQIRLAVVNALEHYMYDSAIFLAERLYAYRSNNENLLLMMTCYFHNNELQVVYRILKDHLKKDSPNPLEQGFSSSEVGVMI